MKTLVAICIILNIVGSNFGKNVNYMNISRKLMLVFMFISIDATEETGKLGRLVNHSRNGNLITKTIAVKEKPHLILVAKNDIKPGSELTYDYGDRSKESLAHHPWLAY